METFKQYYLKETSWNPQQDQTVGGRDRMRNRDMRDQGVDRNSIQASIDTADHLLDDPTIDADMIDQTMIELGKQFDVISNTRAEDLKGEILMKYRQLRELLKQKQVAGAHKECIQLYNNMCDMLFEG